VQPDHGANNLGLQDPSCLIKPECQKETQPLLPDAHTMLGGLMHGWMGGWMVSTPGYCKQEAQNMMSWPVIRKTLI